MTMLKVKFSDLLIIIDIVLAVLMFEVRDNAYLILLIAMVAFFFNKKGKIKKSIILNPVLTWSLLFVLWGVLSSKWAIRSSVSLTASLTTFIWITWFVFIFSIYDGNIERFYKVYKIAVDIIAVYTMIYYGLDSLVKSALSIERVENGFNNVNTLGILFAVSLLISYSRLLQKKERRKEWIQLICMFFMIFSMSSRKSMIMVLLGCIMLTYMKLRDERLDQALLKSIVIVAVVGLLLYMFWNSVIIQTILERINGVFGIFQFTGLEMDGSTWLRSKYIKIGMDTFYEHKIIGIGLDNSRFVLKQLADHETYTHCNYVELLCDTGVIGFGLYYLRHFFLVFGMLKNRQKWDSEDQFAFTIELILLLLDYGMVSYYDRLCWLYMIPIFESYHRIAISEKQVFKINCGRNLNYGANNKENEPIYIGSKL